MIRKGEYNYGRRVFGTNNRLNPLVGKSPASAGVPAPVPAAAPPNPSSMNSQTLLKGSGYYSKTKQDNIPPSRVPPKPVESTSKEETIVIHVGDEKKKIEKDFKGKKNKLLSEMKYFEKHLKVTDSAEDIDISVHCDIKIFDWLMNYLEDRKPQLEVGTVIPILISADFLVMARLIDDGVSFVVKNISEIVKIPIDMSCLNQTALKKISKQITLEALDAGVDPRDSLQSKLFMHKLEEFMKDESNKLHRGMYGNTLFTDEQAEWMTCPRADIFIDYRGRVLANHVPDKNWDINDLFNFIRKNGVSWRRIFWKVWGRHNSDEGLTGGNRFIFAEIDNGTYHPSPAKFTFGSNQGVFECGGTDAIRFTTAMQNEGCKSRSHIPLNLKESSLDYKFIDKHRDLLAEPVKLAGRKEADETEDTKTETAEDNIDADGAVGQSNASLLKSQRKKMRMMSLMELLEEYTKSKNNKNKKYDGENCKKSDGLCFRGQVGDDEDDNEEDDFNLVNPKFNKSNSMQSNAGGTGVKKIKKMQSGLEKTPPSESKSVKMKFWKIDFYRDQDRDKMNELIKKLSKMRKKNKSSLNIRKIVSSQSKVSHKTSSSVNKISNRKKSKK